ncbi:Putative deoxyribonuclease YcfH [hydrothermal vent metagenome]|uniref:Putative deoxyribonuclease YcfH n=1 Tax=hydrothermal vent metagenome TaxID=652676 RepID=A0A1W1EL50_9ZZZZ
MIIDTHCHLDDEKYIDDFDEIMERAKDNNIHKMIIPGADPKTLNRAIQLSKKYDNIYFSVGVHPYDASNYDRDFLEEFINNPKCVAVGECGLDYFRLPNDNIDEYKNLQKNVFIDQIELAKKYNKPLIVHIRDASRDSLDILKSYNSLKGVLHCYNADEELLLLAKRDFYFGIGGVVTFKNAKKLINILPKIPKDKLLIETDAPYLTPTPHRGKRNEPAYCQLIANRMQEILEIDNIASITTENANKLFNFYDK